MKRLIDIMSKFSAYRIEYVEDGRIKDMIVYSDDTLENLVRDFEEHNNVKVTMIRSI
jgi:hypothetical protein